MAHTYSAKASIARTNSAPATASFTCASGVTLLVLGIVVDGSTARTGGAPTYNGVDMLQAGSARQASTSPETTVEMWYTLAPPTGTAYTLSIPNSGSVYLTAYISSYIAAAGNKSALRTTDWAQGTSTNPAGPPLSGVMGGDTHVAVVGFGDDSFGGSSVNGTSLYGGDQGTYGSAMQYNLTGLSQLTWTDSTNEDWVIISAAFYEEADLSAEIGVTKAVGYAVLDKPSPAISVSKAVGYAVLQNINQGINVSKAVGYAVIEEVPVSTRLHQTVVEVLHAGDPKARIHQTAVEVLHAGDPKARIHQTYVEILHDPAGTALTRRPVVMCVT